MSKCLDVITSDYLAGIERIVITSKKAAVSTMQDQARLLFVEVAKVTPPNGGAAGRTLQGAQAEKAGRLAIVRDYHAIYGMPGRAYSDLQDKDQNAADAFWACVKNDRLPAAETIVKNTLGKSFVPFDGGKSARGFLGKKRNKNAVFYISNPAALNAHVAELQKHVWYLASGWRDALTALRAAIPYGVGKQNGPGQLLTTINDKLIEIKMINGVPYARAVKNLQSRIAFAMQVRTDALQRRFDSFLKSQGPKDGFKITT